MVWDADIMMCIVNYISAVRRLKEINKTVYMMGGEEDCPTQITAQRDMIQLEKEYYRDESVKFTITLLTTFAGCVIVYYLYRYGVFNV